MDIFKGAPAPQVTAAGPITAPIAAPTAPVVVPKPADAPPQGDVPGGRRRARGARASTVLTAISPEAETLG